MLKKKIRDILQASKKTGWVLEPDAMRLMELAGLDVPRIKVATSPDEAAGFAAEIGYPVVAKVVSPKILHKSDSGGVVTGIEDEEKLRGVFDRLSALEGFEGMLVEETLSGIELIVGAKIDNQFGPVIVLGIGGTCVEIYKDMSMRMAPVEPDDVAPMVQELTAHELIEGYRGSEPVNRDELTKLLVGFSKLVIELEGEIDSIDLNPVMCTAEKCVVADARIILS